jgi:2,3-bisphosphoglycerate-independent phosphoglycerate mutase
MSKEPDDRRAFSLGPAIRAANRAGEEDEAVRPIVKVDAAGRPIGRIRRGDAVVFYDLRGDREIEITRSLVEPGFGHFAVEPGLGLDFTTLIEYDPKLRVRVAFPKQESLAHTLIEVAAAAGLRVVKIAESEKTSHIGYFFNGKSDTVFPGETRIIIPSPRIAARYDAAPEMSADGVAEAIVGQMRAGGPDLIVANLANVDVVGHLENRGAAIRAVEAVDRALGRALDAARDQGMAVLVTADHGGVEEWLFPDGTINTGHTKNPVPFISADFSVPAGDAPLRTEGELADVAPTVLELLELPAPPEMTGRSLLRAASASKTGRRRVALLVLDGWGLRPDDQGNLIAQSRTPRFDAAWSSFPRAVLAAAGEAAGLPPGTVGNSEAGHLHLGAGRRVPLDRIGIDAAIADRSFFRNGILHETMSAAARDGRRFHLMGIVSHYSSHAKLDHLFALLEMARDEGVREVFVHGFIGRRGERPDESGAASVEKVEAACAGLGAGEVVTAMGRYWSHNREEGSAKVEVAYRALVLGEGIRVGTFSPPERT